MSANETYIKRRSRLKTTLGHGLLLFLGNALQRGHAGII